MTPNPITSGVCLDCGRLMHASDYGLTCEPCRNEQFAEATRIMEVAWLESVRRENLNLGSGSVESGHAMHPFEARGLLKPSLNGEFKPTRGSRSSDRPASEPFPTPPPERIRSSQVVLGFLSGCCSGGSARASGLGAGESTK